ncbi:MULTISPECIES: glycosyltransferase family 2 protein [unclassified Cyanobium]|uniref:glycosyltransferase family 2 protein n=1 Tax=unclassified Cyanobium TaxID=2627006 RepID=UPI0020CD489B|nr:MULTISPECIES: glycosyltransferase family 2 protein [unclassified Cyanobium]MCP9834046.1 glycosyltransferase family 2 protein [Cyanobium sp. La Preciosa 7G6]MCP9936809.1 glycosyltransferase family 2 protein [Cyanobium sp. Aljojuca 7A6]
MSLPLVTAVVPTRNRRELSLRFLARMAAQTYSALRIVVVDANSSDGTVAAIRQQHPHVTVLKAGDRDFWAGATNRGVRQALAAGTDYVLTINDDAVVPADYVARMVALAQLHSCAILGSRIDLLAEPGRIWALGTSTDWGTERFLRLAHHDDLASQLEPAVAQAEVMEAEAMPGNGVLIGQDVFRRVGLYDAVWLPHYHADSEWVMRAVRRGFAAKVTPAIVVLNDFGEVQKRLPLGSLRGLLFTFFHPKSHLYLPAVAAILWRYCPPAQRWPTLMALGGRFLRMKS